MAFPTSNFSIREYALQMRGKDLSKSWPFGEEMAEAANKLLPPLTVRKFRWWSDELEILRSKNKKKDKIKMGFLKGKSRTPPKKRSIAEIFAVAPPVETMMISNDCGVEKVVGDKVVKATSLVRTLVSAMKTIKNNNNKIKDFDHEQLCKRGQRNRNNVSVRSKKPCYKRFSRQKKEKLVKQSNVAAKQQRPMPQVIKSILKHSVKVVSETNSSSTSLKCSNQVINNGGQKSNRRVSFSDKDDFLGPSTKAFSDTFEKNDESPFEASERSTESGESNKGVTSMEVGVNDNNVGSFSARHEVDSQYMNGKIDQLPNIIHDPVNAQSSMSPHPCSDNANHSAEKLISVNRVLPHENNLHLFDHVYVDGPQKRPSVHSAVPAVSAAREERQYEHVRAQRRSSSWPREPSFYGNSVDDHLNNPINGVAALNSSENAVGRFLDLAESSAKDTRCRFPNWEKSTVAYKEKDVNDGFVCLPLNSKGELIQLNSGLINRFDRMNEASNNIACSSRMPVCGLVVPRSSQDHFIDNEKLLVDTEFKGNQLTLFPLHSNMQENRNRYSSAGFDVDEPGTSLADIRLGNFERGIDSGTFFLSNSPNPPFNRCRHYGNLHNQNVSTEMYAENPTGQTMRLMGKDVAICGNGKEVQEPEVINFWKNSTSVENCLTNPVLENPMGKRNFVQNRMFYPAGFHGNQMAQRNLFANAPQVRYPHPHLDRKNSIMYQRSDSVINLNERFNNIHVVSPSSTDQAFNMAPNFLAPFISGPETLRFGSQPSAFSSHHICTNKYENSFELGFNQNLHPAKLGAFNFPFLQPDDENHVQLPCFHSSYGRRWGEAPTVTCERFNRNGYYNNPFISSDTDVVISPPMQHPHEAAYPFRTMTSHLQMKNMRSSTPFFQPIPVAPRVQSPSIRTSTEDRLNFNTLSVKNSALSKNRPAADLFDLRKRQKVSSLEMSNTGALPCWIRGKFMDDVQSNQGRKAEIQANWEKAVNSAGNISNLTQTDECMARSGRIKLTAGAKHILKPSQSIDLDNTKPIYSTIPSSGLAHSVSLAESQKSTKVYSF